MIAEILVGNSSDCRLRFGDTSRARTSQLPTPNFLQHVGQQIDKLITKCMDQTLLRGAESVCHLTLREVIHRIAFCSIFYLRLIPAGPQDEDNQFFNQLTF